MNKDKKSIIKKIIFGIILDRIMLVLLGIVGSIGLFIAALYFFNPFRGPKEVNPDDPLTEIVYEKYGDQFKYIGSNKYDNGVVNYSYEVKGNETGDLKGIVDLFNQNIIDSRDKIMVSFWIDYGYAMDSPFSIRNYSTDNLSEPDYDGLYVLRISFGKSIIDTGVWRDFNTYTVFDGVRRIDTDYGTQICAREEGINWREIWPELENIIVDNYTIWDDYNRRVHGVSCMTFDSTHGDSENIYIKPEMSSNGCSLKEIRLIDADDKTVLWCDDIKPQNNVTQMYYIYEEDGVYSFLKIKSTDTVNTYRKCFKLFYLNGEGDEIVIDQMSIFGVEGNAIDEKKLEEYEKKLYEYLDYSTFLIGSDYGEVKYRDPDISFEIYFGL